MCKLLSKTRTTPACSSLHNFHLHVLTQNKVTRVTFSILKFRHTILMSNFFPLFFPVTWSWCTYSVLILTSAPSRSHSVEWLLTFLNFSSYTLWCSLHLAVVSDFNMLETMDRCLETLIPLFSKIGKLLTCILTFKFHFQNFNKQSEIY